MRHTPFFIPAAPSGARRAAVGAFAASIVLWCASAGAFTYYIDENLSYTNHPPCVNNPDLNVITAQLQTEMNNHGWTGSRFTDASSWPTDFTEACSSKYGQGGDSTYADNNWLAVFAGHGLQGLLAWGFPHDNMCTLDFAANIRLGQMAGARANFGMYLACDVLAPSSLVTEGNNEWLLQQFSFAGTIGIDDDDMAEFFDDTAGNTNADAWLNDMPTSAIVVSYDDYSENNCWLVNNSADLVNGWGGQRGGPPACGAGLNGYWYCYEYTN